MSKSREESVWEAEKKARYERKRARRKAELEWKNKDRPEYHELNDKLSYIWCTKDYTDFNRLELIQKANEMKDNHLISNAERRTLMFYINHRDKYRDEKDYSAEYKLDSLKERKYYYMALKRKVKEFLEGKRTVAQIEENYRLEHNSESVSYDVAVRLEVAQGEGSLESITYTKIDQKNYYDKMRDVVFELKKGTSVFFKEELQKKVEKMYTMGMINAGQCGLLLRSLGTSATNAISRRPGTAGQAEVYKVLRCEVNDFIQKKSVYKADGLMALIEGEFGKGEIVAKHYERLRRTLEKHV